MRDRLRGAPKRLQWPVVSVGSISAGGAGKTPVVIALAKMLRDRGWDVDVLSRGYGRTGHGVEWVAALGDSAAERYGDEPVVIARAAGVPVWGAGGQLRVNGWRLVTPGRPSPPSVASSPARCGVFADWRRVVAGDEGGPL